MSDSSNNNVGGNTQQPNAGGGGLKQSTPLVTVQNVHSGVKTAVVASSASIDHPLATPPPPAAAPPTIQATSSSVELSQRASPAPPTATAAAAVPPSVNTPKPTPPSKKTTPTVAKLPTSKSKKATTPKKQALSLDEMANDFLSVPIDGTSPKLKPPPLPKEQEGMQRLQTLVTRRAWGDVLSVCGQMLRGPTSCYTQLYSTLITESADGMDLDEFTEQQKMEVVEILTLECHAWLKLRRYNELGREVDKWNFLNNSESSTSSLTWIPWSLHILAAESLQYTDPSSARATDALYTLRDVLVEQKEYVWLPSVDNALANSFLKQKEWRLACAALDNLRESIPASVEALVKSDSSVQQEDATCLTTAFQCEVLSRQGRIMLQIGALQEAALLFDQAKTSFQQITTSTNHWIFQHVPIQIRINDGLLSFAYSHYDAAMTHFRKCMELLQSQSNSQTYDKQDWMGPTILRVDLDSTALSNCCNNLALCALYTCRMQDAVQMMETLVRKNPSLYLTERLAFNLSTLYELGSDAAASTRKKRVLQLVAKRFFLHDIGPESFRVS